MTFRAMVAIGTMSLLATTAATSISAQAMQVSSSDGVWTVGFGPSTDFRIGREGALDVRLTPNSQGACAQVTEAVLEMPQHGHGADSSPRVMANGLCQSRVEGIAPTMRGRWRLRLILGAGNQTSVADIGIEVQ
ncbi:hypothetical protein [Dyella tabacisoli]|uniref:YtkA-like domain-containing protein n=1 Tax=Dyella tabacisoli TaxID=2282381 RepID=A0A369UIT9_9GAMM|nr:hypothetical protein [Dyella tabacisoli]RDD80662.1 hypothetical protein DVJ77_15600 [Dyella tabacisoli]